MLPRHLIEEFWDKVEKHLTDKLQMTPEDARKDMEAYRTRLASHGVNEMIYHSEPEEIAQAIKGGGFRTEISGSAG